MKYDAFISYRHTEPDLFVAKSVHKGLETFRVPGSVKKSSGKKNIRRVFRDQEELPIGSDLGANIEGALQESEFLIVICSPRTPESYWVNKEIETFIRIHDRNHILAVLIEGEPEQSFPKLLLTDENGEPVEPLAADLRAKDNHGQKRKLRTEIIRMAAPILGCSYDDLRQRHRERKRRKRMAVLSMAFALIAAFAVYSAYNAAMIQKNYEDKQANQSKYLADTSLNLKQLGDSRAAVLVALEALPYAQDRPYVASAEYALANALDVYETGDELVPDTCLTHDLPVSSFFFSEDGEKILTIDQGDQIYVWDIATGKQLYQAGQQLAEDYYREMLVDAFLSAGGNVLAVYEDYITGTTLDNTEVFRADSEEGILYAYYDSSRDWIFAVSRHVVRIYDGEDGKLIKEFEVAEDRAFSGAFAINEEGTKAAVSYWTESEAADAENHGAVAVLDLETGVMTDIFTENDYINCMEFLDEESLAVASYPYDLSFKESQGQGVIENIRIETGEAQWDKTYSFQMVSTAGKALSMRNHAYTDAETGESYHYLIYAVDNNIVSVDAETGEQLGNFTKSSSIDGLAVSGDSGIAMLMERNGSLDYVNLTDGTDYTDNADSTELTILDAQLKNGILAVRQYQSPDLILFTYKEGSGWEKVAEFEESVYRAEGETGGKYLAISFFTSGKIAVLDKDTKEIVYNYEAENTIAAYGLVGDKYLAVMEQAGKVTRIDLSDLSEETMEFDLGYGIDAGKVEDGCLLAYNSSQCIVADLECMEVLTRYEAEEGLSVRAAAYNVSSGRLCIIDSGNRFHCVDTAENTDRICADADVKISFSSETEDAVSLSEDGNLAAVNCSDGKVRILNLTDLSVSDMIPFAGNYRVFLKFSPDNSEILMQGDDYVFRVYDLMKKQNILISREQYYEIREAEYVPEKQKIVLTTSSACYVLGMDTCECSCMINSAISTDLIREEVFSADYHMLVRFPYYSLEMLYKEADNQIGDAALTEQERVKYNID